MPSKLQKTSIFMMACVATTLLLPTYAQGIDGELKVLGSTDPNKPIQLDSNLTRVRLTDFNFEKALRRTSGTGVYLTLEDVRASIPVGVLYEVLLGRIGSPSESAVLVGYINFFAPTQPLLSFDVSGSLQTLASGDAPDLSLELLIRPVIPSPSAARELQNALQKGAITVRRAQIVAQ